MRLLTVKKRRIITAATKDSNHAATRCIHPHVVQATVEAAKVGMDDLFHGFGGDPVEIGSSGDVGVWSGDGDIWRVGQLTISRVSTR